MLCGLGEFEVTGAVESAGGLEVSVRVARPDAACPRCGVFSWRVKEYRTQRVRDGLSFERPTVLIWTTRRFRCETPGCVSSFTESTRQIPPRRRVTARLCVAMARVAWDRSTAAVARTFMVSWPTAWRAIVAAARSKIAGLPTCPPRRLGIDETTFGRHRSFMTGLVDLDTSRLWDLIEGRSKKALGGTTEPATRRRVVEGFRDGKIGVLVNYGVFREGFDAPKTRAIIVARPVYSPHLYFQMIGRGLRGRLNGGDDRCLILNVRDNIEGFGHALAFSDLDWLWDR